MVDSRRGIHEGLAQPLLVSPCLLLLQIIPRTQVLGRGSEHNMDLPSGEISICSTHECGMSKLLSSSSLPCLGEAGVGWAGFGQGWALEEKSWADPLS